MTSELVLGKVILNRRPERFVHVILADVVYDYYSVPVTALLREEV